MISCHDWWPWSKPGYITMTRRQCNSHWSGGIAAHPDPKNSECKSAGKVLASIWDQDSILLIDYLPKGQTVNAECYSSLLVQLKDILKDQEGLVLAQHCPGSRGTCNPEETDLLGLPLSWSPTLFSRCGPVGLPPVPWTGKTIERSPIFIRRGNHCCHRDLVGWTTFWIFFERLAKVRAMG